jgi:acyl-CoA thioester hydrolase
MRSFSEIINVSSGHLDWNNHVNNMVYLQWALDISRNHWLQEISEEIATQYFWVVKSHHIEYKKQAFLNEELTINTYVKSIKGPISERVVEIWRNDVLIAQVTSNWCFLDAKSQKPKRVPEEIQKLFQ